MEEDLGFIIQVVTLIIVLAIFMKVSNVPSGAFGYLTNPESPGTGLISSGANLRFQTENQNSLFLGDGQHEKPVYWNQGSVEETNSALQKAAAVTSEESLSNPAKLYDLAAQGY